MNTKAYVLSPIALYLVMFQRTDKSKEFCDQINSTIAETLPR